MPVRRPEGAADLRAVVEARLTERLAATREQGGVNNTGLRLAIDGLGIEYVVAELVVVFHAASRHVIPIYEFPMPDAGRKAITAPGEANGNELMACGVPAIGIAGAYVEENAGGVVGREDAGFVLFFNERLGYWHLAEAGVVSQGYDSEEEGFWGREEWRLWAAFLTPEMLGERVTLDTHLAGQLFGCDRDEVAKWVVQQKPPLEALTLPGDEWRVWVSRTEPLMQMVGLALVRRDRVVWARQDWIS